MSLKLLLIVSSTSSEANLSHGRRLPPFFPVSVVQLTMDRTVMLRVDLPTKEEETENEMNGRKTMTRLCMSAYHGSGVKRSRGAGGSS